MEIVQRKTAKEEGKGRDDMHICQDMCEEILLRLEVKDLLRFKSVCHGWYELISNTNFKQQQLQQSMADPEQNHHRIYQNYQRITIDYNSCFDDKSVKIIISTQTVPRSLRSYWSALLMGSCDGLICLSGDSDQVNMPRVMIWNPCSGELLMVPKPNRSSNYKKEFYWFGRDNSIISSKSGNNYKLLMGFVYDAEHFAMYTLNSNGSSYNWREIEVNVCEFVTPEERGTLLNGIVHWTTFYDPNEGRHVVVAYDLSLEKFGKISAPNVMPACSLFTLGVFNQCLSTIFKPAGAGRKTFEVWTMKEYGVEKSWTKLIKLEVGDDSYDLWYSYERICIPLGLKNGDLLVDFDGKTFVRYNISTGKITAKFDHRGKCSFQDDTLITHVESLISPHQIAFI